MSEADSFFARLIPFMMRRQRELYLNSGEPIEKMAARLDEHVRRKMAGMGCVDGLNRRIDDCPGCQIDRDGEAFIALEKIGIKVDDRIK